jgi:hypothetical protein
MRVRASVTMLRWYVELLCFGHHMISDNLAAHFHTSAIAVGPTLWFMYLTAPTSNMWPIWVRMVFAIAYHRPALYAPGFPAGEFPRTGWMKDQDGRAEASTWTPSHFPIYTARVIDSKHD